jgi:hypothetical protein
MFSFSQQAFSLRKDVKLALSLGDWRIQQDLFDILPQYQDFRSGEDACVKVVTYGPALLDLLSILLN